METIFCPYCKSPAWQSISFNLGAKHYIQCIECKASGPVKDSSVDALEEWIRVSERVNDPVYMDDGKF